MLNRRNGQVNIADKCCHAVVNGVFAHRPKSEGYRQNLIIFNNLYSLFLFEPIDGRVHRLGNGAQRNHRCVVVEIRRCAVGKSDGVVVDSNLYILAPRQRRWRHGAQRRCARGGYGKSLAQLFKSFWFIYVSHCVIPPFCVFVFLCVCVFIGWILSARMISG